jgi:energy-coupling factor transport system substrate-specific component
MKSKRNVYQICLLALAVCINLIGGQLALLFRLPIYLDSIGTMFIGALCGPVWGMLPNLLSGLILGMTVDVYSLYFAPVGMIVGLMSGLVWNRRLMTRWWAAIAAMGIAFPGTLASALICAKLFGGITSSGSTVLVQLLARTPLGMTASVFVVQIITDYADRLISLLLVIRLWQTIPEQMKMQIERRTSYGRTGRTI